MWGSRTASIQSKIPSDDSRWKEGMQAKAELNPPIHKSSVIDKYILPEWFPKYTAFEKVVVTPKNP